MSAPVPNRLAPVVAVLAGGASKRMGQDKALMTTSQNNSLLALVCAAARNAGRPVIVVGRISNHLPADMPDGCHAIPDIAPGCGPLGGLDTALAHAQNADVILCACDVPRITSNCFTWITEQYAKMPDCYDGLLPQWQGRDQPLFAVYRQSLAPTVRHLLESGLFAMKHLQSRSNLLRIELPESCSGAVTDWDTPEDIDLPPRSAPHRIASVIILPVGKTVKTGRIN